MSVLRIDVDKRTDTRGSRVGLDTKKCPRAGRKWNKRARRRIERRMMEGKGRGDMMGMQLAIYITVVSPGTSMNR